MSETDGSDGGVQYKFTDELISPILAGEKTATVRVDDERHPEPNDTVAAVNRRGVQFTTLRVRASLRVQACWAYRVIRTFNAGHRADSPSELITILNEHYDRPVRNADPVHVVVFDPVTKDRDA
jgi:hypothetical protein